MEKDISIVISDKVLCMGIDLPVRTCCLMEFNGNNVLKIAKIEIVGNEWQELGSTNINEISNDSFQADFSFL